MGRLNLKRWVTIGLVLSMLWAPATLALADNGAADGGMITHVVSPGENLYRISLRYGVSVQAVMRANGLTNSSFVRTGQRLLIPTGSRTGSSAAPLVPAPASPQGPQVQDGATTHVVAPGENLYRIGLRYGQSVQAMAWANGLKSPYIVYTGQHLVIPNRQGTPAVQPVAPAPSIPSSPPITSGNPGASHSAGKEIVVVLHEQKVYAYENGQLVRSSLISSGIARYPTRVGQFHIYAKYISTLMTGPGYYLPNVPYTMYYSGGYALHGTYWHSNFGRPMSHGCVNMPTAEATWLFEWAPVGTLVTVQA